MWVKFLADFTWKPQQRVTIDYKTDMVANVTTACAEKAIAAGKAEKVTKPKNEKATAEDES